MLLTHLANGLLAETQMIVFQLWAAVERQPPCPRATTTLAGFQAAEVGVFVDFLG